MGEETYETEGPKCPCCGRQYTADEPYWWSITEETCDSCGETFDVSVYTETTWTCSARATLSKGACRGEGEDARD